MSRKANKSAEATLPRINADIDERSWQLMRKCAAAIWEATYESPFPCPDQRPSLVREESEILPNIEKSESPRNPMGNYSMKGKKFLQAMESTNSPRSPVNADIDEPDSNIEDQGASSVQNDSNEDGTMNPADVKRKFQRTRRRSFAHEEITRSTNEPFTSKSAKGLSSASGRLHSLTYSDADVEGILKSAKEAAKQNVSSSKENRRDKGITVATVSRPTNSNYNVSAKYRSVGRLPSMSPKQLSRASTDSRLLPAAAPLVLTPAPTAPAPAVMSAQISQPIADGGGGGDGVSTVAGTIATQSNLPAVLMHPTELKPDSTPASDETSSPSSTILAAPPVVPDVLSVAPPVVSVTPGHDFESKVQEKKLNAVDVEQIVAPTVAGDSLSTTTAAVELVPTNSRPVVTSNRPKTPKTPSSSSKKASKAYRHSFDGQLPRPLPLSTSAKGLAAGTGRPTSAFSPTANSKRLRQRSHHHIRQRSLGTATMSEKIARPSSALVGSGAFDEEESGMPPSLVPQKNASHFLSTFASEKGSRDMAHSTLEEDNADLNASPKPTTDLLAETISNIKMVDAELDRVFGAYQAKLEARRARQEKAREQRQKVAGAAALAESSKKVTCTPAEQHLKDAIKRADRLHGRTRWEDAEEEGQWKDLYESGFARSDDNGDGYYTDFRRIKYGSGKSESGKTAVEGDSGKSNLSLKETIDRNPELQQAIEANKLLPSHARATISSLIQGFKATDLTLQGILVAKEARRDSSNANTSDKSKPEKRTLNASVISYHP